MGTELLYPQDLLRERIRFRGPSAEDFSRRKSSSSSSPNQKSWRRDPTRKRSIPQPEPFISKRSTDQDDSKPIVMMGQVTILKRGESLDSKKKHERLKKTFSDDVIVSGADRLGPEPGLVPKEIRIGVSDQLKVRTDIYAGSACYLSPSPRALPLPTFSVKKNVENSATKDLRRLLRLD